MSGEIEANAVAVREHVQEYLTSHAFDIGGYVLLDMSDTSSRMRPYDLKILHTLFQNASLLYQNIRLRERLKDLFVKAEKEAVTDHMTGLFNHRYFVEQLNREFHRASRHHLSIALLMIDIDHFKIYNDNFGHQAGDIVLTKVANLLKENTRATDIVARYGGEEFIVICPELDREGGRRLAEKLCVMIAEEPFLNREKMPGRRVTVSLGVAAYPSDASTAADLIKMPMLLFIPQKVMAGTGFRFTGMKLLKTIRKRNRQLKQPFHR